MTMVSNLTGLAAATQLKDIQKGLIPILILLISWMDVRRIDSNWEKGNNLNDKEINESIFSKTNGSLPRS